MGIRSQGHRKDIRIRPALAEVEFFPYKESHKKHRADCDDNGSD